MQKIKGLRNTISTNLPLSEIDSKVLKTLIKIKGGNAYTTWKASGLKHYPTVLRSLKKLEANGCIEVSKVKGMRGEKQYVPTLPSILISLALEENLPKIREIITNNSSKFRELSKANVANIDDWAVEIVEGVFWGIKAKRKTKKSFDEILEEKIYDYIDGFFINILTERRDAINEIIESARAVEWMRQIAFKVIEALIDWSEKEIEALKKTKEMMTDNFRAQKS
jgi:predicted transcriptional regulator